MNVPCERAVRAKHLCSRLQEAFSCCKCMLHGPCVFVDGTGTLNSSLINITHWWAEPTESFHLNNTNIRRSKTENRC